MNLFKYVYSKNYHTLHKLYVQVFPKNCRILILGIISRKFHKAGNSWETLLRYDLYWLWIWIDNIISCIWLWHIYLPLTYFNSVTVFKQGGFFYVIRYIHLGTPSVFWHGNTSVQTSATTTWICNMWGQLRCHLFLNGS